jgi:hypothetical protein
MEDPSTMADSSKWEMVVETMPGQDYTQRLRVDAGYLYCRTTLAGASTKASGQVAVALSFVPDRATP